MSKANNGLTNEKCASLSFSNNGKNKLFDGAGLYLEVTSNGSKRWRMRYKQKNGKETLITFGEYPTVSLEQARKARENVRNAVAKGEDPTKARDAALANSAPAPSTQPEEKAPLVSKTVSSSSVTDKQAKKDEVQIPASLSKEPSPAVAKPAVASSAAPAATTNARSSTLSSPQTSSSSFPAPAKEQKIVARSETTEAAGISNKEQRVTSVPVASSTSTVGKKETVSSDTGSVQVENVKTIQGSAIPKTANTSAKTVTPASSNVTHINPVAKGTTVVSAQAQEPSSSKKILYRSILVTLLIAGGVFLFEEYRLHQKTAALQEAEKQLVVADGVMQQSAMLNSEIKKLESEATTIKKENQDLLSINQRLEASQSELIEARDIAVRLKDEVQAALDKALVLNGSLQAQLKEIRAQLARSQQMYHAERETRERVQQNLDTEQQNSAQINSLRNEYLRNRGQ